MGVKTLKARSWVLLDKCTGKCSVNKDNVGDERSKMVHGWYEEGLNDQEIAHNSFLVGLKLSSGALGRHRANHMEPLGETRFTGATKRRTDLEIIEAMIQQGGERAESFKMTPSETMKAMELKYKLTQGSAFEGMLEALNRASMEEDDLEPVEGDPSMADVTFMEEDDGEAE